jgi:hypothetical protein
VFLLSFRFCFESLKIIVGSMYYSAMGGRWPVLFWLAAYGGDTLRQSSTVLGTWWLGVWAQAYVGSPAEDVRVT